MKTVSIIILCLIISCQNRIGSSKAKELGGYLGTLESSQRILREYLIWEAEKFRFELEERGLSQDSAILEIDENLRSVEIYSTFISSWKTNIIDASGGYGEYDHLPKDWNKSIAPTNFISPNKEVKSDTIQVMDEKSVLMTLIQLTNLDIKYANKIREKTLKLIDSKIKKEPSELFLISEQPNFEINGPLFYSFNYYPIDSLEINGKWHYGNEYVEIPREEWDLIKKRNLRINLPVKLFWGDTTFQFTVQQ